MIALAGQGCSREVAESLQRQCVLNIHEKIQGSLTFKTSLCMCDTYRSLWLNTQRIQGSLSFKTAFAVQRLRLPSLLTLLDCVLCVLCKTSKTAFSVENLLDCVLCWVFALTYKTAFSVEHVLGATVSLLLPPSLPLPFWVVYLARLERGQAANRVIIKVHVQTESSSSYREFVYTIIHTHTQV